jgi:hypothetical protein
VQWSGHRPEYFGEDQDVDMDASKTQEVVQESDMRVKALVGVRMSSGVIRSTPGMIGQPVRLSGSPT